MRMCTPQSASEEDGKHHIENVDRALSLCPFATCLSSKHGPSVTMCQAPRTTRTPKTPRLCPHPRDLTAQWTETIAWVISMKKFSELNVRGD